MFLMYSCIKELHVSYSSDFVLNNPLRRTYFLTVVAKFKKENIVHLGPIETLKSEAVYTMKSRRSFFIVFPVFLSFMTFSISETEQLL